MDNETRRHWIAEETRLWQALMATAPITAESRKGLRLTRQAKLAGRPAPKLPSDAAVTGRSWHHYHTWISH